MANSNLPELYWIIVALMPHVTPCAMPRIPKDHRDATWKRIEKGIQSRADRKDRAFTLRGKWKTFIRRERGYRVFSVDAEWIRNNLCVYFGHGGHGRVHEFIPLNEIWIATHHYNETRDSIFSCGCKTMTVGQKVTKPYFDSTTIHEITECEEMKKGKPYWTSHHIALEAERQSGLLPDPFDDTQR